MLGACTKEGKTSGTGTEEETAGSPASRSRTGIVGTGQQAAGTEAVIPGNCSYTMRDGIRTAAG